MSGEPLKFKGEELKFPVDWEFRIVAESAKADAVCKAAGACLASHGIDSPLTEGRGSGGGRYLTLRVDVVLKDRETMNLLSAELAKIDGVKFLL